MLGAYKYAHKMKFFGLLGLLAVATTTALGQSPRRVSGTVYDSIGRAPLPGAVVEVVMVDTGRGRIKS
jgi:hypothetical protein